MRWAQVSATIRMKKNNNNEGINGDDIEGADNMVRGDHNGQCGYHPVDTVPLLIQTRFQDGLRIL